ncbi:hypothetical protein JCGZ_25879 [Jatropha curcas]|uniref:ZF-HD dimerization-type domain-containing protein n=2 Tax=Jatropha curcas TaxID=180498 RepID=A0A067JK41_JATCU|nr:hypothetical protein JCGZ_25879 [Jatropha curcas]
MNNSSPQKDIPFSRNGGYARAENGRIIATSSVSQPTSGGNTPSILLEDQSPFKKVVSYKECLKNHAAAIGGNATDGCGEFMPSGEQGTLEALRCSACNCHRNFHRKEIDGEHSYHSPMISGYNPGNTLVLGHRSRPPQGYLINPLLSSRRSPTPQMIVSYRSGSVPSEYDEKGNGDDDGDGAVATSPVEKKPKKRFRTKFTEEQKQEMLNFAEKAGWKMQNLEESAVQRLCQGIGIKRRVFKVWMHNNKHQFAKKNSSPN